MSTEVILLMMPSL